MVCCFWAETQAGTMILLIGASTDSGDAKLFYSQIGRSIWLRSKNIWNGWVRIAA
jgi:hypothetical protein